jgi:tetraacyldisaccharide 4'-kinase
MRRLLPQPAQVWYQRHWLALALAPLGWLYCAIARLRRWAYRSGRLASFAVPVPVIVVGNLTVGGTGKTPLVLWLADHLRAKGKRVGIALRGYRGRADSGPQRVAPDADPAQVGDEAVLLAQRSGCPVVVGRDRVAAARMLVERCDCELLVCDDGLQHYRLQRQLEILVIDGQRRFGNGRCLPAGPLREPRARARAADLVIVNGDAGGDGYRMRLEPGAAINLQDPTVRRPLRDFVGVPVTAVAGIGNPERFFMMLERSGLAVTALAYPDHHAFGEGDLRSWPPGPVLMTEKDAVKCRRLAAANHWYLPVRAVPDGGFVMALEHALRRIDARPAAEQRFARDR